MRNFLLIISIAFFVISCTEHKSFDQYNPIKKFEWLQNSAIEFIVNNTDTISKKNGEQVKYYCQL